MAVGHFVGVEMGGRDAVNALLGGIQPAVESPVVGGVVLADLSQAKVQCCQHGGDDGKAQGRHGDGCRNCRVGSPGRQSLTGISGRRHGDGRDRGTTRDATSPQCQP